MGTPCLTLTANQDELSHCQVSFVITSTKTGYVYKHAYALHIIHVFFKGAKHSVLGNDVLGDSGCGSRFRRCTSG